MMSEKLSPELEDLHAYVDGQLPPQVRERVAARLAADPVARRQAEDYAAIREGLHALYDPILEEQVPAQIRGRPPRRTWLRPAAAMAASVLLLVTGVWIGMHLQPTNLLPLAGTPHVAREAAMAYAVYTPEVRHPVEVPGDQEDHLVAWLTKRMGTKVHAPRLDALGFVLVGGRLMSSDDGPGALLMYENAEGRRVVLYACHNEDGGRDTAFRFAQEGGVSVFHWVEGPLSYALAGELDRSGLLAIAESVYRQIAI
jgi:anti-sigma factor RsiW